MRFSLLKMEAAPKLASEGKFDCSSPTYEDFKEHLRCNLRTECEYGEDELGLYRSTECLVFLPLHKFCDGVL